MNLSETLKAHIMRNGAIPISEYMRTCVSHYYANQPAFGREGDFITAPEISQIFGEVLGAWIANAWLESGSPQATLVELGGGRGTLMKDVLRATKHVPEFHARTRVVMVEQSPRLAEMQLETLSQSHTRITTCLELSLPPEPCFILANEFFDALPIVQTIGGVERRVIWCEESGFGFQDSGKGKVVETCPEAKTIMQTICTHIKTYGGAFITADYGYTESGTGSTLQALKHHAYADVFAMPGEADITAHVDFSILQHIASQAGLKTTLQTQGEFLHEMGAELRANALCVQATEHKKKDITQGLERLTAPEYMGALFKVLTTAA